MTTVTIKSNAAEGEADIHVWAVNPTNLKGVPFINRLAPGDSCEVEVIKGERDLHVMEMNVTPPAAEPTPEVTETEASDETNDPAGEDTPAEATNQEENPNEPVS